MREICTSGSEGGVAQTNAPSLPPIKVDAAAGLQKNRHFRVLASLPQQVPHPLQFLRQRQLRDRMNAPSGC